MFGSSYSFFKSLAAISLERNKKSIITIIMNNQVNQKKTKKTTKKTKEIGGPSGPDPTRYGDWEKKGICYDF